MTCTALIFDDPVADPAYTESCAKPEGRADGDSLFETFVDDIDAWARQALAANGFGDYV